MADLTWAVQKAVHGALAGITAPGREEGAPVACPTYDHQPENAPFPFIVLSGQNVVPDDTLDADGSIHTLYLSIWSQYRGQRQVLAIMASIADRLHNARLLLDVGCALSCRVRNRLTSREPDDITYQGAMTIQIIASS
ncbi:MAG: DUF3168 domain-containing protein [Pseudomonadota bacterium]